MLCLCIDAESPTSTLQWIVETIIFNTPNKDWDRMGVFSLEQSGHTGGLWIMLQECFKKLPWIFWWFFFLLLKLCSLLEAESFKKWLDEVSVNCHFQVSQQMLCGVYVWSLSAPLMERPVQFLLCMYLHSFHKFWPVSLSLLLRINMLFWFCPFVMWSAVIVNNINTAKDWKISGTDSVIKTTWQSETHSVCVCIHVLQYARVQLQPVMWVKLRALRRAGFLQSRLCCGYDVLSGWPL